MALFMIFEGFLMKMIQGLRSYTAVALAESGLRDAGIDRRSFCAQITDQDTTAHVDHG
jgi:hypothetical protein